MFSNAGMTKVSSTIMTPIAMHDDGDRVDQRAAHLARQLDALLDVDREAVQDRVEDAAHLAGLDEVDEELVEDLRVAAERVAEGRALLDGALDVRSAAWKILLSPGSRGCRGTARAAGRRRSSSRTGG